MKNLFLYILLVFNACNPAFAGTQTILKADVIENTYQVKNYLGAKGHFEKNVNGVNAYADAAAATPVDMTGGSPALTCTRTTSTPLSGEGSLLITKDAVNRQGNGCSIDFSIDVADQGKVIQGVFDYAIASGTFVSNDVDLWVFDLTNSALIAVSPYHLLNHTLSSDKYGFEFQTASNSTSYRVGWHVASTSALAYTVKIDNVQIGRLAKLYGSPITDWVSYTPIFTGFGTATSIEFQYRKNGSDCEIRGKFVTGTTTAVEARISLPTGFTSAGTGIIPSITAVGSALVPFSSGAGFPNNTQVLIEPSVTYVTFQANAAAPISKLVGTTFTTGNTFSLYASIPIQGWSSSQIMSSDASTRSIVARVGKNGAQAIAATGDTKITSYTVIKDNSGMWDSTNNRFNIQVPGDYQINHCLELNAGGGIFIPAYRINGTTSYYGATKNSSTSDDRSIISSVIPNLKAGDYVELIVNTTVASGSVIAGDQSTWATLNLIQGPAQIASSDFVGASYYVTTSTSTANNVQINFDTMMFDTHGSVTKTTAGTSGTWKFTAPVAGYYQVTVGTRSSAATTNIVLSKNGAGVGASTSTRYLNNIDTSTNNINPGVAVIYLLAGEYIDVRPDNTFTVVGSGGAAIQSAIDIIKVSR
jgi:hypothetical protein